MAIGLRRCLEFTVVGALFLSCTEADRAPQYVAWKSAQAVTAAQAGRLLGEACSLGEQQCSSKLCLHYAEPDKRVCTKVCEADADCPATWAWSREREPLRLRAP